MLYWYGNTAKLTYDYDQQHISIVYVSSNNNIYYLCYYLYVCTLLTITTDKNIVVKRECIARPVATL